MPAHDRESMTDCLLIPVSLGWVRGRPSTWSDCMVHSVNDRDLNPLGSTQGGLRHKLVCDAAVVSVRTCRYDCLAFFGRSPRRRPAPSWRSLSSSDTLRAFANPVLYELIINPSKDIRNPSKFLHNRVPSCGC